MSDTSWRSIAAFVGRLIFAGVFAMAVTFKFLGMGDTAGYIAAAALKYLPQMTQKLQVILLIVLWQELVQEFL